MGAPVHHTKGYGLRRVLGRKVARNMQRDRDTDARLIAAGWLPVRVWEHEDPIKATRHLVNLVRQRMQKPVGGPDRPGGTEWT